MTARHSGLLAGCALPLATLAGCGGGGGGGNVASTPAPVPAAVTPTATPTPAAIPARNYDSAEYRRSNAATQAQALTAYNAGATGAGVLVGVIDSGVDATSAEFAGRISPLSADIAGARGIQDEGGHGTAVADVLLGARNDTGIHGIAFDATLLALRTDTPGTCANMSAGGNGCSHSDRNIAAALDAAVAARARVVNISLGGTPADSQLRAAIDRATASGTIIVIAAGNDGVANPAAAQNPDTLAQVANDGIARGLVVIAGAADASGTLADFSNRAGNSAANYVTAAGVRVRSVDNSGAAYLFSGTSFSAPVVSGAIALIAQAFPDLTPAQIVALLYRSADDRGATGVDAVYGNGEINLARAFSPIGALSLAAAEVPVSLDTNATLGSAMGDAASGRLRSVIRDEFGRRFDVDLSPTLARAGRRPALAPALAMDTRSLAAAGARTSLAVAIDGRPGWRPALLTPDADRRARVLAGSMAVAINAQLTLGFGGGIAAETLVPPTPGRGSQDFLVADHSLDRAPTAAFAMRHVHGGTTIALSAESGDMRLWQRDAAVGTHARRYGYTQLSAIWRRVAGPVSVTARLSRLGEHATILGSRFGAALGGSGTATWFVELGATATPAAGWWLEGRLLRGWTPLAANMVRGSSTLLTQAWSALVARNDLFAARDRITLRYAAPLRVTRGALVLPGLGDEGQQLALAPSGEERDLEAAYARPAGAGWLTLNGYWRRQPGHYAAAPDDFGAAVRWELAL